MSTATINAKEVWEKTGMVKGVKVRKFPVEGNACDYGVGSDTYGGQIRNVSEDGSEFDIYDKYGYYNHAKLVTRKNSPFRGCYLICENGKVYTYRSRGYLHGMIVGISDKQGYGTTYLDPSF